MTVGADCRLLDWLGVQIGDVDPHECRRSEAATGHAGSDSTASWNEEAVEGSVGVETLGGSGPFAERECGVVVSPKDSIMTDVKDLRWAVGGERFRNSNGDALTARMRC